MRVTSVQFSSLTKIFRLADGRTLQTHRYCCLKPGDDVDITESSYVYACCQNGTAQILPIYKACDSVKISTRNIQLTVKEIETGEELEAYHKLEEYHYRGKVLHGRRVPLIVCSIDPFLPLVLGYIELATTFIMNRPRAVLLNAKFQEGNIAWAKWDRAAVRQYTNLVVRIARVVVSPEFRGLGLARILVKHAARFAQHHWHVGGLKPLFLEITADMLRYVPFVESAGMHYIGDTEGNVTRVRKDMKYVLNNFSRVIKGEILKEESSGIVDLQVSYATHLKRIEDEHGIPREKLLRLLLRSPHRLSDEQWELLYRILRLPKPTFLMGLTSTAERFVQKRVQKLGLPARYPAQSPKRSMQVVRAPIEVRECTLTLSSPLIRTQATRKIQQVFGISRDMLTTTLFANLSFTIRPGDIVLICGPSGAGKTTLLSLLIHQLLHPFSTLEGFTGKIEVPTSVKVATLAPLSSSRPLINVIGNDSFEHALFALNVSGLAEAHLYVKRFRELSNGQRYRAMVAKLIASSADIWVADEFCATLDPITANIVSRNLRRCAKEFGATVILAAANWTEFIHELSPDTVIHLRSPWEYKVFSWSDFQDALARSHVFNA